MARVFLFCINQIKVNSRGYMPWYNNKKRCKDCSFCNFKIWFGFQRCHSKSGLTKNTNYESMECCTQGVQWTLSMQHDGCHISCQWDCCKLYVAEKTQASKYSGILRRAKIRHDCSVQLNCSVVSCSSCFS